MYMRTFTIENIRSIFSLKMDFERGKEAGWHVVLGPNGAGKSSVIRSFALLCMGPREAFAARQDFNNWMRAGADDAFINGLFVVDHDYDIVTGGGRPSNRSISATVKIERVETSLVANSGEIDFSGERVNRTIWGSGLGWFSCSFGPFRRFTGGDRIYDRLFVSNKRLAPHLTALGEDVALTEALGWLNSLYVQNLQDLRTGKQSSALEVLDAVMDLINESAFLPHGARVKEVDNERIMILDGNGAKIPIAQLSDGYRSALSLTIELVRQMFELYGYDKMLFALKKKPGVVDAPGVVAIDEIDAHLHPTWQKEIGRWLTKVFPKIQFIVTTHSPIICRAAANEAGDITGSIWRLPTPGSSERFRRVQGVDLDHLVFGDVLDAYGTELFGSDVTRSKVGARLLQNLAQLNQTALARQLTDSEKLDRRKLRSMFPSEAGMLVS